MKKGEVVETKRGLGRYVGFGYGLVQEDKKFYLVQASVLHTATEITEKDIAKLPDCLELGNAEDHIYESLKLKAKGLFGEEVLLW